MAGIGRGLLSPEDVFLLWPNSGKSLEVYALFSTVRWAHGLPSPPPRPRLCTAASLVEPLPSRPASPWVPVSVPDSVTPWLYSLPGGPRFLVSADCRHHHPLSYLWNQAAPFPPLTASLA